MLTRIAPELLRPSAAPTLNPGRQVRGVVPRSVFQPIFSVAHRQIVGHEALVRGSRGAKDVGAQETLSELGRESLPPELERSLFKLHVEEFVRQRRQGWLFLNVDPNVLHDREELARAYGSRLAESSLPSRRVVIEIVEKRAPSECALAQAVEAFRDLGCWIAIDDFGAGESNFQRIWRIRPEIVKLDRAMLTEASRDPGVRRLIPGIVSLLHEAGCLVVLEGIETEEQALLALESDVDFVQGYLFSRPSAELPTDDDVQDTFRRVVHAFRNVQMAREYEAETFLRSHVRSFEDGARLLSTTGDFSRASLHMIRHPGVQRVFLLDNRGVQVGNNLERDTRDGDDVMAFGPFVQSSGADWFRRPYFQRALASPFTVQVSRRYLSLRDARPCVTLSMTTIVGGELRVICADIDPHESEV